MRCWFSELHKLIQCQALHSIFNREITPNSSQIQILTPKLKVNQKLWTNLWQSDTNRRTVTKWQSDTTTTTSPLCVIFKTLVALSLFHVIIKLKRNYQNIGEYLHSTYYSWFPGQFAIAVKLRVKSYEMFIYLRNFLLL